MFYLAGLVAVAQCASVCLPLRRCLCSRPQTAPLHSNQPTPAAQSRHCTLHTQLEQQEHSRTSTAPLTPHTQHRRRDVCARRSRRLQAKIRFVFVEAFQLAQGKAQRRCSRVEEAAFGWQAAARLEEEGRVEGWRSQGVHAKGPRPDEKRKKGAETQCRHHCRGKQGQRGEEQGEGEGWREGGMTQRISGAAALDTAAHSAAALSVLFPLPVLLSDLASVFHSDVFF